MKIRNFIKYFIASILIINFAKCDLEDLGLDPHIQKRTKVLACVSLAKSRMSQDVEYVDNLIKLINEHFSIQDGKNKLLSLALVNCYSRIGLTKGLEV
jgi:hypothetical protein